jgi:hypothetical protein
MTTMKTLRNASSFTFGSIALFSMALLGLVVTLYYFLAELHQPEYLIYFAPLLGLLFYGSYFVINHKLDTSFLHGAYNDDSKES